jgi:hypothetical protein
MVVMFAAASFSAITILTRGAARIGGNLYVGGALNVTGAMTYSDDLTLENGETIDNATNGTINLTAGVFKHGIDALAYWTATQADGGAVTFNSTSDGTAGFTFSDLVTFSAGIDIGTSQSIVGTTAMTIGSGAQTLAINSSDWDIDATGVMTGIGAVTMNGILTQQFDAAAYWTSTVADGGGVTFDDVSDGTASFTFSDAVGLSNDLVFSLGTTLTNAETKITAEFDETTTGIGLFRIGDLSNPQVLNANPGATVVSEIVNINHSAGAGDCDDLIAVYNKVNVIGDGDAGTTVVGHASRAYVGLTGGANNSVASQAYGSQPWARHQGTGAVTAMSGVSAKLDVGADNWTASTANAGHFHIDGAATVTGQFDGVMIEVYPAVKSMDNALAIAIDAGAVVNYGVSVSGTPAIADAILHSGAKIFTGTAANGDAVYAEVGAKDAIGSIYLNATNGYIYIQVANAGAATDWYKVTASDAD